MTNTLRLSLLRQLQHRVPHLVKEKAVNITYGVKLQIVLFRIKYNTLQ